MPESPGSILVVDDEADIREALEMVLRYEKYEVQTAADGDACLTALDGGSIDAVLLDVKMPGRDGLEILEEIRNRRPDMPVVMISGHADRATGWEAAKRGAFDFLDKPLDEGQVLVTVRNAMTMRRVESENAALRGKVAERWRILGHSAAIGEVLETIEKVAPTQARVLLTGGNGAGKELVARNLHERSNRWRGPFVEVNCAAIPTELVESELFGHTKGAFTGAVADRAGKFEQAHGGTLFLDEIGDMDLSAQAKVLRALEEGEIEPVGGSGTVGVDVRVIAATNKDLQSEVEEGNFREDLFYRLAVVPIHLPPLASRREDVPLLARHFLEEACKRNDLVPTRRLAEDAEALLSKQDWPGNVRQLRNLVERVSILCAGPEIDAAAVEPYLAGRTPRAGDPFTNCATFEEFKEQAERMFLQQRLEENDWNIKRTAEVLGMQRSNLYKKIDKYEMR
ncbi:MAG: sigma-54-dependent transcriptional regulator [Planctomycetota bacterium]|jgi:two-component system nitrogen regulation response regulator NtrX